MHTYIHTHIHTYIHKYIYTYINAYIKTVIFSGTKASVTFGITMVKPIEPGYIPMQHFYWQLQWDLKSLSVCLIHISV
jgi:hypothetical protein